MPRVEGTEVLKVDPARLWRLLNDPAILGSSIPGCEGLEREEGAEHRYRTAIMVAVGAVKGLYRGTIEYREIDPPTRCTIAVSGAGQQGTIDGEGRLTLADRGSQTEVGYDGQFRITGRVAGVGQRYAPAVSRRIIVDTLRALERAGTEGDSDEK